MDNVLKILNAAASIVIIAAGGWYGYGEYQVWSAKQNAAQEAAILVAMKDCDEMVALYIRTRTPGTAKAVTACLEQFRGRVFYTDAIKRLKDFDAEIDMK